jgi:hypothetical protein
VAETLATTAAAAAILKSLANIFEKEGVKESCGITGEYQSTPKASEKDLLGESS